MHVLHLTLLGGFEGRLNSGAALVLPRKKAQALLAYLVVDPTEAHLRDKLAALLWGDSSDQQARHSLRQTLHALKQALARNGTSVLRIAAETVAVDSSAVNADVAAFERFVADGTPPALAQAARLYKGDFLEGLAVQEPRFEEWLVRHRERLRELALEGLAKLLAHQTKRAAFQEAIQTASKLLGLDPLQEAVHRALMRLYAQQGRRGAALRQYQMCVAVLQRELGVEPEASTKQLYQEMLKSQFASPSVSIVSTPPENNSQLARVEAAADPAASDTPLVARDMELAALQRLRAEAWQGQARIAAVLGEAGIGKSRLIEALVGDVVACGGRALVGRAHDTERILPFGPWVDAFRSAGVLPELARQPGLDASWRMQLARLFPELGRTKDRAGAEDEDHVRLFEAIVQAVRHLAQRQPLLLVFEDLHWADDMSLRLLAFVSRRGAAWPVMLVGTIRREEIIDAPAVTRFLRELGSNPHFVALTLGRLSKSDTVTLVRLLARVGTEEPALQRIGTQIWRSSEGNPFMVVETVRSLYGTDAFVGSDAVRTPPRVRDLVAARLDRLSERSRNLAALASVIGREFDFALLDSAVGSGGWETAASVEELVARHILHVVDERLDFTHDRIREVAYERLLPPRRKLLHAAVAHALEAIYANDLAPHYVALSRHCQQAALWHKAATYLQGAGFAAATRAAHREAVTCFEQALAALDRVPDPRAGLEQSVDLRFALRNSLAALGEHAQVLDHLRAAETTAEVLGDRRRLGWVSTYRTNSLYFIGQNEAAVASGETARSLAEDVGDVRLRVIADFFLGQACHALGQFPRVATLMRQSVHALDDESSYGDHRAQQVYACSALACCLAELGIFAEALASVAAAMQIATAADRTYPLVHACFSYGFVYLRNGDLPRAVAVLERGLGLCHGRELPVLAAVTQSALGYAYALSRRVADALPLLEAAADALTHSMRGSALATVCLGEGYLVAGRQAQAADACEHALGLARERKERGLEGWALRLQGEIAARLDVDTAEAAYRGAIALAADLGMSPLQAEAHLGLGRCYRHAGRLAEARAEMIAAVDLFRAMQSHWLAQAETELRACGGEPARRGSHAPRKP